MLYDKHNRFESLGFSLESPESYYIINLIWMKKSKV